ncbi:unnamed protein product [Danaus chrysippus]|uniref:(African queen) hypothetical protein n=1 Tax=Danaus chrysippus TaxID=151541 RepID=A0A8J2VXT9_9NEOP|nr:unnamed protein product [Danaus chrysippus]
MNGRLLLVFVLLSVIGFGEMKKRKMDYPTDKQLTLQKKETTPVDFTRLLVMRVVYGLAKVMGFEEQVGEVLNGALVPPGADEDDDFDDDDGLFDDY